MLQDVSLNMQNFHAQQLSVVRISEALSDSLSVNMQAGKHKDLTQTSCYVIRYKTHLRLACLVKQDQGRAKQKS